MNIANKFWRKWCKADELERIELTEKLMERIDRPQLDATLFNSYFVEGRKTSGVDRKGVIRWK